MKSINFAIAALGALSVALAPISASAAPARAPSEVSDSEALAGGSALMILAALAAAAFLILVVADEDSFDDVDDLPASP
jgi:hypothetical protein